jgi:DNA-binding MarR family transcriptional regulator
MQRPAPADVRELDGLVRDILGAFFDLRVAGQALGLVTDGGQGSWGLLRTLVEGGPVTMADFARSRGVSRQYIQKLAAELIGKGLLRLIPNPADARAGLMALTPRGTQQLSKLDEKLDGVLREMSPSFTGREIAATRATLQRLRERVGERARRGDRDR